LLKVNRIFYSIQGESTYAGLRCVFIRLTGCNLRCSYCDTQYAWEEGETVSLDDIMRQVDDYECRLVEITGGEPLLQPASVQLADQLIKSGYQVLIETNGSMDIGQLPDGAIRIMDIKCPDSGEEKKNNWANLDLLNPKDEIKFVISSLDDYRWAKYVIQKNVLSGFCTIHFAPAAGVLEPSHLAQWILEDNLDVRFHLQMHKMIWPDEGQER